MNQETFPDITHTLKEEIKNLYDESGLSLRKVKNTQIPLFRKEVLKNPDNEISQFSDFHLEDLLVLHEPQTFDFYYKPIDEEVVAPEFDQKTLEPFYLSNIERTQFIPCYISEDSLSSLIGSLFQESPSIEVGPQYNQANKRPSIIDQLQLQGVQGSTLYDDQNNIGLFYIENIERFFLPKDRDLKIGTDESSYVRPH